MPGANSKDRIKPGSRCASSMGRHARRRTNERRYLDLVPVVFSTDDGVGCTRDLCSACWMEHKGGVSSTRTFTLEQAQRRQREGLQHNPFGDGWFEHLICRKYVEATKEVRRELNGKKETILNSKKSGRTQMKHRSTPHHAFRGLAHACREKEGSIIRFCRCGQRSK